MCILLSYWLFDRGAEEINNVRGKYLKNRDFGVFPSPEGRFHTISDEKFDETKCFSLGKNQFHLRIFSHGE